MILIKVCFKAKKFIEINVINEDHGMFLDGLSLLQISKLKELKWPYCWHDALKVTSNKEKLNIITAANKVA